MNNMTNIERMIAALEIRAEKALVEGRLEDAKVAVLESFDLQKDSGFMKESTMNLLDQLEEEENMTNRMQEILFIRAEREIASGDMNRAVQVLGELYDHQAKDGFIESRLYSLIEEVVQYA